MMHVTSITDDYILYEAPLIINGKKHDLTVAYDIEDTEYRMLTARLDESETGGVPPKDERLLVSGDVVTTMFYALDPDGGEPVTFKDETFKIGKQSSFGELELPDGTYVFMFLMIDGKDNYYYSDISGILMEDGEAEIFDPEA
jgi:hypothetical protein